MLSRRGLCLTVFLFLLLGQSDQAAGEGIQKAQPWISLETEAGTERLVNSVDAFIPLAETDDGVLYGSLAYRHAPGAERQVSAGSGFRWSQGGGVAGVSTWIDTTRTRAGKVYSQMAVGAEHLGNHIDLHANAYAPLGESKVVGQVGTQGLTLAGSGIIYGEGGLALEGVSGGWDAGVTLRLHEQGKEPSFRFGAGYYAYTDDALGTREGGYFEAARYLSPSLDVGARLTSESSGDVAAAIVARWTFYKHPGSRAASPQWSARPVRQRHAQVARAEVRGRTETIKSAVTGNDQRVFYVDNRAPVGGDGSIERPFSTLGAAAVAANQTADIIYVSAGNGTSSGYDTVVTLRDNQMLIGSASEFRFESSRFANPVGVNLDGSVLRPAGARPVITGSGGVGVFVEGDATRVTGIEITGQDIGVFADDAGVVRLDNLVIRNSGNYGIYAEAVDTGKGHSLVLENSFIEGTTAFDGLYVLGSSWQSLHVVDSSFTSNGGNGINIVSAFDSLSLERVSSSANGRNGVSIDLNGQTAGHIDIEALAADNNTQMGLLILSRVNSGIDSVSISDSSALGNAAEGIFIEARNISSIGDVGIIDSDVSGNGSQGLYIRSRIASEIDNVVIDNVEANDNAVYGIYAASLDTSRLSALMRNSSLTNNGSEGLFVDDDTSGDYVFDAGGGSLGSVGNNRIFSNVIRDLTVDLDGGLLKAENNWWGNAGGLAASRRRLQAGSSIDAVPFLSSDPGP